LATQGHANLILDNLTADKKAVPMIIVMDNGYANKPANGTADNNARPVSIFEEVVINEIIPMVDTKFRTIANRRHRAIAGLSMGANQTMRIIMNNLINSRLSGALVVRQIIRAKTLLILSLSSTGSIKMVPLSTNSLRYYS
jgi:hypothetical protein